MIVDSMWDIEKYCLTYKKDSTTYELYDEQQILYPCITFIVRVMYFCVGCLEARNKPSRGAIPLLLYSSPPCNSNSPLTPLVPLRLFVRVQVLN